MFILHKSAQRSQLMQVLMDPSHTKVHQYFWKSQEGPEQLFTEMSLLIPRISELLIAAFQCSAQALPACGPRLLHLPSGGS